MAAVTIEAARAARKESQRLRVATTELRGAAQKNNRAALQRREEAAAAAAKSRNRRRLEIQAHSPWSKLPWHRDDAELETALVPVD